MGNGKDELRSAVRSVIRCTAASHRDWSHAICEALLAWPVFERAAVLLSYAPLANEVDLTLGHQDAQDTGKTLCLPRIDWEAKTMVPAVVTSLDSLVTHRHGILEPPEDAPAIPLEKLDLILVPGVAFDEDCNRLGRGGGFYDRFLATVPPLVKTCGVAFEAQMVRSVPTDPHDRPVDAVVTESRLILRTR